MQTTVHSQTRAKKSGNLVPFHILIAYEELASGKRAMNLCDYLTRNLKGNIELHKNLWNFNVLSIPEYRMSAVVEAKEVDLIMISMQGNEPLPFHIKEWIDGWIKAPNINSKALVLLINHSSPNQSPAYLYLKDIAERSCLQFFAHGPEEVLETPYSETRFA
jgi:hypothetical protein